MNGADEKLSNKLDIDKLVFWMEKCNYHQFSDQQIQT